MTSGARRIVPAAPRRATLPRVVIDVRLVRIEVVRQRARRRARPVRRSCRRSRRAPRRRRRPRPAAACPSTDRARSPSRCCSRATRRSALRPPTADASRRARCAPASRRGTRSCARTTTCARSTAAACRSASSADTSASMRPALHSTPRRLQLFDEERVGVLHEQSADDRHRRRKLAARVDRLQEREVVSLARRVVVRTERRRHVHHAAAVVGRHELLADDDLVVRALRDTRASRTAAVPRPDELRARRSSTDRVPALLVVLAEHARATRASARMSVLLSLSSSRRIDLDVVELRMHRERRVRHERPRRRRPHENAPLDCRCTALAVGARREHRARCRRSDPRRPRSPARARGSTAPCRSAGSTAGSCGRDTAASCRTAS